MMDGWWGMMMPDLVTNREGSPDDPGNREFSLNSLVLKVCVDQKQKIQLLLVYHVVSSRYKAK